MANEDFTTYTEEDESDKITVTSSTCTVTDMDWITSGSVYRSLAVSGNFSYTFETRMTSAGTVTIYLFALGTSSDVITVGYTYDLVDTKIILQVTSTGADTYTFAGTPVHYHTLARVGTTITDKIYSDAARTTLLDTLTIVEVDAYSFETVFGVYGSEAVGEGGEMSCYIKDLNLGTAITKRSYSYIID